MTKRATEHVPDARELRKSLAERALKVAKERCPTAFIGEQNDAYFYLAIPDVARTEAICAALAENGILAKVEHREMLSDDALYLEEVADEPEEEQNETDEKGDSKWD